MFSFYLYYYPLKITENETNTIERHGKYTREYTSRRRHAYTWYVSWWKKTEKSNERTSWEIQLCQCVLAPRIGYQGFCELHPWQFQRLSDSTFDVCAFWTSGAQSFNLLFCDFMCRFSSQAGYKKRFSSLSPRKWTTCRKSSLKKSRKKSKRCVLLLKSWWVTVVLVVHSSSFPLFTP